MTNCYCIVPINNITLTMIRESAGTEASIRHSNNGFGLLKFGTMFPDSMAGYAKHSAESIRSYLAENTAAWGADIESI